MFLRFTVQNFKRKAKYNFVVMISFLVVHRSQYNSGPLAKKEVRQALNYSLDRSELREKSIGFDKNDKESPCEFISGPFVQSSAYYNHEVPPVEFRIVVKQMRY